MIISWCGIPCVFLFQKIWIFCSAYIFYFFEWSHSLSGLVRGTLTKQMPLPFYIQTGKPNLIPETSLRENKQRMSCAKSCFNILGRCDLAWQSGQISIGECVSQMWFLDANQWQRETDTCIQSNWDLLPLWMGSRD